MVHTPAGVTMRTRAQNYDRGPTSDIDADLRERVLGVMKSVPNTHQAEFLDFVLDGTLSASLSAAMEADEALRTAANDALDLLSDWADVDTASWSQASLSDLLKQLDRAQTVDAKAALQAQIARVRESVQG